MSIYDKNNTLITEIVASAVSKPDVVEIVNRTLDGSYHVQTIGTKGTKLDVTAYFTKSNKLVMDSIKANGDTIKVTYDGAWYTGLIEGELSWERLVNQSDAMFATQIVLLVTSQGVI